MYHTHTVIMGCVKKEGLDNKLLLVQSEKDYIRCRKCLTPPPPTGHVQRVGPCPEWVWNEDVEEDGLD